MPRKTGFAGAPIDLTASVAAHSGSLRHDAGPGRRFLKTGANKGLSALFFYLAESVGFEPTVLAHAGLVPRKTGFAGAPFDLTASVAAHSGSLRHDAGTGRRFLKTGAKKGLSALFFYLAESVGFEPTVLAHAGLVPHKSCAFAGAPIDLTASVAAHSGSLRHDAGTGRRFLKTGAKKGLSALFFYLAESVGFEPTVLAHAGFQDRCLQPLGQLSG